MSDAAGLSGDLGKIGGEEPKVDVQPPDRATGLGLAHLLKQLTPAQRDQHQIADLIGQRDRLVAELGRVRTDAAQQVAALQGRLSVLEPAHAELRANYQNARGPSVLSLAFGAAGNVALGYGGFAVDKTVGGYWMVGGIVFAITPFILAGVSWLNRDLTPRTPPANP